MKAFGIAIASVALTAVLATDSNTLPANKNIAPPESAATLPNMPAPDADAGEPVAAMPPQTQEPNDKAKPQTQPPDDNAPPRMQAPIGQAQPASNDSRVSGTAQSPTPVPLVNNMKLAPVRLGSGNTIAVLSDSGSQSVILATALATEPNALSAKTAALQTTATPPTSAALGASAAVPVTAMPPQIQVPTTKAPPQTQAPTSQVQLVTNDTRMPSGTSAPHSNGIQPAPVNPVRGDTTTPPPGADAVPPAIAMSPQMQAPNAITPPQTQPPNADTPPQTQAPNPNAPPQTEIPNAGAPQRTQAPKIQAQLTNNNTRAPGNDTLTPRVNHTKPTFVKPIGGKPLATSSDSRSQSADAGDKNERTSTFGSESHSSSGFNSSKSPKSKPKKSDAATVTATAGLVSAAIVVVVVAVAFM